MSQDGKPQIIPRKIKNDRPIKNKVVCACGGSYYASPSSHYAHCSSGEIRCTRCGREARRFRKGLTCGHGCSR